MDINYRGFFTEASTPPSIQHLICKAALGRSALFLRSISFSTKLYKQWLLPFNTYQRYPICRLYRIRNIEFVFSLSVVRSPIVKAFSRHQTQETVLSGVLPLSISVKVALTTNICTNDGLANAEQGALCQIIYNQNSIDYESSKGTILYS